MSLNRFCGIWPVLQQPHHDFPTNTYSDSDSEEVNEDSAELSGFSHNMVTYVGPSYSVHEDLSGCLYDTS